MRKYNVLFQKYSIVPTKYEFYKNVTIVNTDNNKYVIKGKNREDKSPIFNYLNSRSFDYYPKILSDVDDEYEITEYIEQVDMPIEQKMSDMIDLVALLHSKTTHYEEVDEEEYKEIYEDINNNIAYLYSYYTDLIAVAEASIYMSPSQYMLALNISKILGALNFCKDEIDKWYKIVKEKRKQRLVVLHNNLDLSHFIKNKGSYLISWNKAKIDIPIFDLYKLYRRHSLNYEFSEIFKRYEHSYPLLEEEKKLFFILISLPDKLEFSSSEYQMCNDISNIIETLARTENFISPYYSKNAK
ncbi:MAG: hypothetical protein HFI87_03820 [Bacilli bacterium]|nr:hypothetical protein [Bacilli bacterium]